LTPESGGSGDTGEGGTEQANAEEAKPLAETGEQVAQAQESVETPQAVPQVEGRRTQLRVVRENIESLSRDVGAFRKNHEATIKRLDAQLKSLRKELAAHAQSKELSNHAKNDEASSKRLEKQVATLRSDVAALKTSIAKDAAKTRAREEAVLSKILAKVSTKPSKSSKRSK